MPIWQSPGLLLLLTGGLLGVTFPLGKLAAQAGIPPAIWAFAMAFGAGAVLLTGLIAAGGRVGFDRARLRYFLIAAIVSYALPNLLLFSAIPRLGAGFTGILFTLSPLLTLLLSVMFRLRRPSPLGIAGIAIGFAGALVVALTRGEAGRPADLGWIAAGLCIPLSLAVGNIYRTLDWPKGAGPIELAVGSNLAAAVLLAGVSWTVTGAVPLAALADAPALTLAQVVAAAAMFGVFFRLQVVGGPVYLSQIGYVGAAVGLVSGTLLLDERYTAATWTGAAVIGVGVALTTLAQRRGG